MIEEVAITSDYIKLDAFLKFAGLAETGGHAKILVLDGTVKVGDEICLMRGKKLYPGDIVEVYGNIYKIVRSGLGEDN